jgi:hypothetical protein
MNDMKKPSGSELLEFAVPQDVEGQLVNWIRGVVESNNELVDALSVVSRQLVNYPSGRVARYHAWIVS